MTKLILKLVLYFLLFIPLAMTSQTKSHRKPDLEKIRAEAQLAFKKAIADKNFKKTNSNLKTPPGVLDYNALPTDMRIPGQFEESQAIAMTWEYELNAAGTAYSDIPASDLSPRVWGKIVCDLAAKIQLNAKVLIRIKNSKDAQIIINIMANRGTPLVNYDFYVSEIDDLWDRDSGPISFYYGDQDNIGMLDMDYYTLAAISDNLGNVFTDFASINTGGRIHDDAIPIKIAEKFGYPVYHTPLNNEGGNIIADGLQSIWTSTECRKANVGASTSGNYTYYNNYPPLNNGQFESLFLNSYKATTFVEPKTFLCDGGTGHLDIYSKLIDENNLGLVDYAQAINHTDYATWNTNLLSFQNRVDSNGKPITIHLLPMPLTAAGTVQTRCEADQRTYINGIFVNKGYIMPISSNPLSMSKGDADAVAAFQKAMPGYTIHPINAGAMYGSGGSLHCITMQIPAENPVFIRHNAITGDQPLQANYQINAFIKNKSGLASQFVYYRKSTNTDWIALPMTSLGSNNYTASIPTAGFAIGDTIEYFIEATSNNGKTISKPFVAREGGYTKFTITGTLGVDGFNGNTNFALSVYPNPSNGSFTLPVSVDDTRKVNIEIVDMIGRTVYFETSKIRNGLHLKNITLTNASGVYIVKTTIDGTVAKTQRLVIK